MSATPSNDEIAAAARKVRQTAPDMGAAKVLAAVKDAHPDWALSEQRLRKVMKEHGLGLPHPSLSTPQIFPKAATTSRPSPGAPGFYRPHDEAPAPALPIDARAEQLRYQKESPRSYKLYGRGTKWDYAVTWNVDMQLMVTMMQNRMLEAGLPRDDRQKQQWAEAPPMRTIFEQLWPAAQRAGLTRADLGRQLEAEWGANPEPLIFYPRTKRELTVWEAQRADEAAKYKVTSMRIKREMARAARGTEHEGSVKTDARGQPLWDEEVNGQYVVILSRLHKGTDIECGDLPQTEGWDFDMPCSHTL
ncbi:hypothetical protein EXIGLDRAFT_839635 [Exidia glandulosa HHB12029]|uniref:Uncharacterized protein n=1 Tax=Exidia glandulosa HHB12029 TaxID=1314781 RepID=A0A165EWE0_EXIGL|nr:hypothetical protein EXIGLDRAFT_839635 [Exidia glandulosa HHB12029]